MHLRSEYFEINFYATIRDFRIIIYGTSVNEFRKTLLHYINNNNIISNGFSIDVTVIYI